MMFDVEEHEKRLAGLEVSDTLDPLREVEEYFFKIMKEYPSEYSHDCTAMENPYFKTIGYTNYAHSFIMYPLQFEMAYRQTMKANGVGQEKDFAGYFEYRIQKGIANKYKDREKPVDVHVRNLVVLPGSNKIVDNLSLEKLVWILDNYPDVGIKPHPLTELSLIEELKGKIGDELILPLNSDLYGYMINCENVFTTHMSESAAYAVSLGKRIFPVDKYEKRLQQSFSHLNGPMFLEHNPRGWLNKTFSDYRSGLVNPELEENWKEKMRSYLDFIHDERELFLNAYM